MQAMSELMAINDDYRATRKIVGSHSDDLNFKLNNFTTFEYKLQMHYILYFSQP